MYYLGKTKEKAPSKVRGTKPVEPMMMPEEPMPKWPLFVGAAVAAFFIYKATK
jgi:hypothetical protein